MDFARFKWGASSVGVYSVDKLITEARRLAAEFRKATGKPLAVTGEIAIHDVVHLMGLVPAPEGTVGWNALGQGSRDGKRIQIKGRAIFNDRKSGHRIGQLNTDKDWDSVMLVLFDEDFEPYEIYEAERDEIIDALRPANQKRTKRGILSVSRFKSIGKLVWSRELGQQDDGRRVNTDSL